MTPKFSASVLALTAAFSLAACASAPQQSARGPQSLTPTQQFPIEVKRAPEQIALAIHAQGLSPNQQTALSDLLSRWHDDGGGSLTIRAPINGVGDPALSRRTADAILGYLQHLGAPADRLHLVGYDAQRAPGAPVLVSFDRFEAVGPDCRGYWDNLTSTRSNEPSTHFGCAVTANIAAMIANPRDLVTPAAVDPADNSRRQVVLGKYRQGQVTSAAQDDQASGKISGN